MSGPAAQSSTTATGVIEHLGFRVCSVADADKPTTVDYTRRMPRKVPAAAETGELGVGRAERPAVA
jgi:hypothetical protein